MVNTKVLSEAKQILCTAQPLRFDCGKLCDRACCIDGDEPSGMYLYPGEEAFYSDSDWLSIVPADAVLSGLLLAHCSGHCNRENRPLACMFFPLIPYITASKIVTVKMDPRALPLCPLAKAQGKSGLQPSFLAAARKAARILATDPVIYAYMRDFSEILEEYTLLPWHHLMKDSGNI